jgi:hypothetical protein
VTKHSEWAKNTLCLWEKQEEFIPRIDTWEIADQPEARAVSQLAEEENRTGVVLPRPGLLKAAIR